jgi:hypothetical protein
LLPEGVVERDRVANDRCPNGAVMDLEWVQGILGALFGHPTPGMSRRPGYVNSSPLERLGP